MALTTATISGQFVRPDNSKASLTAYIEAATSGNMLTFDGGVILSKIPVKVLSDGTASVTIWQLPQTDIDPPSAQWRLVIETGRQRYTKQFSLTTNLTWDDLVDTSPDPAFNNSWRLGDLSDVNIAGLADGNGIFYDAASAKFKPGPGGGGGGGSGNVAGDTHAATSKGTPADADELPLADSAASFGLKKLTWANLIAKVRTSLTKSNVGLDQVDNTSDLNKPISDATQLELDSKSDDGHIHDDRYMPAALVTPMFKWKTGDATPWWVAGNNRPANMFAIIVLATGDAVPSWKTADDLILVGDAAAAVPAIRSFANFTALTADAGTTVCVFPANNTSGMQDGDTLWLCVATTGSAPTTPSGWSVAQTFLSSGASGSDGVIVYSRTLGAGEAATLGGTSQSVSLGTTTSAVATIIAWTGSVSINQAASHVDDANTSTAQTFGAVTPTAASKIVGVSAIRYNTLSGGTNVGPRTGWTELFDRSTAKAGAPQRGLLVSVRDADGANGVATSAATGNTPGPLVRTAEYTIAVV